MFINELIKEAHENAVKHGFWEDWIQAHNAEIGEADVRINMRNNALGNRLMLITGEVAEAHEALRKGDIDNLREELADIVIRVADLAGGLGVDLDFEVRKKMDKNRNRPYKHGKAF